MEKVVKRAKEVIILIKLIIAKLLVPVSMKEKCWLISERGHEAKDNGYFFFVYLKENHPEIDVRYVISFDSPDFYKLSKYKDSLIDYGSFLHYKKLHESLVLISTHIMGYTPNMNFFGNLDRKYCVFRKQKKVFLQHGITKDFLPQLMKDAIHIDLFCCGAKPEYDYIIEGFGHNKKVVKYTGLCRYDNLHDCQTKKQILVMPTWRLYLDGNGFETSSYFINWSGLLSNVALHSILNQYGYELVFYPHYEIQKHIHLFKELKLPSIIKIADIQYDVQQLLKESKALVTDYSSVYFDMSYMRKPVVLFQFDEKEFRQRHYKRGYFLEDSLGIKCLSLQDTVTTITQIIKQGCMLDKKYETFADSFFEYRDQLNCERVFNAINDIEM